METWEYEYEGNSIRVQNGKSTELYVNGVLQDSIKGIQLKAVLIGSLPSGKQIRATLGGLLEVECKLFAGEEMLSPIKVPIR